MSRRRHPGRELDTFAGLGIVARFFVLLILTTTVGLPFFAAMLGGDVSRIHPLSPSGAGIIMLGIAWFGIEAIVAAVQRAWRKQDARDVQKVIERIGNLR